MLCLWFSLPVLKADFIGYQIDNQLRKTVVPFELSNNLIIVPVMLNDSLPMKFILDTGVRTTLLMDDQPDFLEISHTRTVQVAGMGNSDAIEAYIASNISLTLPGISGKGQSLVILKSPYLNLASHLGMEVHGIIGYDFFNHFVVEINYPARKLTIYDPNYFKPSARFHSVPLRLVNDRPYIDALLEQATHSALKGSFLLDTGASYGLLLEIDDDTAVTLPEKHVPAIVGWGLGGEIEGNIGRLKKFSIGKFRMKNVLASYITKNVREPVSDDQKRIGSVGGEILSRFHLILDYKEGKLYLKKNSQYSRPFEYNLSGLDIIATGADYTTFKVVHVLDNSPAAIAGVQSGDILISVDGKGIGDLSLEDLTAMFRKSSVSRIRLIVWRNDQGLIEIKFRLKRMI